MTSCEVCTKVKAEYKKAKAKIAELESVDGLIDADLVRSVKAMFYEEVAAILRAQASKNKKTKENKSNGKPKKKTRVS